MGRDFGNKYLKLAFSSFLLYMMEALYTSPMCQMATCRLFDMGCRKQHELRGMRMGGQPLSDCILPSTPPQMIPLMDLIAFSEECCLETAISQITCTHNFRNVNSRLQGLSKYSGPTVLLFFRLCTFDQKYP
jgi:hypothetical protein